MADQQGFAPGDLVVIKEGVYGAGDAGIVLCGWGEWLRSTSFFALADDDYHRGQLAVLYHDGVRQVHFTNIDQLQGGVR